LSTRYILAHHHSRSKPVTGLQPTYSYWRPLANAMHNNNYNKSTRRAQTSARSGTHTQEWDHCDLQIWPWM